MSTPPQASLLGLPPELRNTIYELVVFHMPSNGIIAPISDRHGETVRPHPDQPYARIESITLISGERMRIDMDDMDDMKPTHFYLTDAEARDPNLEATKNVELQQHLTIFEASANNLHGHICTLNCLVQPPVTLVNRQIRNEALPIFYSTNTFHFEMSNFPITYSPHTGKAFSRSPTDWWRACGDTNLRCITSLTLVGHPYGSRAEAGHIVHYSTRNRTHSPTITTEDREAVPSSAAEDYGVMYRRHAAKRPLDSAVELVPYTQCLEQNGLHVRGLESVVAVLEPEKVRYLRDYSALGRTVMLGEGRMMVLEGRCLWEGGLWHSRGGNR